MAGGDNLKLVGMWASPHVLRVQLALCLKGLSYEFVEMEGEQGLEKNKGEQLLLNSKLPVLIHGGKPIRGKSLSMIQYIDEAFVGASPSLLPDDPSERAMARYWADFIDDMLVKAMHMAAWGKTDGEKAKGKNQVASAVETLEGALRECSNPFFGGNTVGYVDVILGGLLGWVRETDAMQGVKTFDDPSMTPLLAMWADRFSALKEVLVVMPDVGALVDFAMPTTCARSSGPLGIAVSIYMIGVLLQMVASYLTWLGRAEGKGDPQDGNPCSRLHWLTPGALPYWGCYVLEGLDFVTSSMPTLFLLYVFVKGFKSSMVRVLLMGVPVLVVTWYFLTLYKPCGPDTLNITTTLMSMLPRPSIFTE
ncbi:probable glutathione S-transferase GSTU6 [Triticum dicoccoides]|uniref:probable glutathione S-transferase GSTU6 n=1 Tax=Triticum dicoccoides TaxID=85692 RepID=UPI00188E1673|nr:probable glutathione S-transferase GSTU6 [Triticum dicoccoides]